MSKKLDALLRGVRAAVDRGESGDREFATMVRETEADWRRLARYLHARWEVPPSVAVEDVQQELLIAARCAVQRWDPERGTLVERFAIWSALDKAGKWIHKQREAYRRDRKSQSRYAVAFSSLSRDEQRRWECGEAPAGQEAYTEAVKRVERVGSTRAARVVAEAVICAGMDPLAAAELILADADSRLVTGLETRAQARRSCRAIARALGVAA